MLVRRGYSYDKPGRERMTRRAARRSPAIEPSLDRAAPPERVSRAFTLAFLLFSGPAISTEVYGRASAPIASPVTYVAELDGCRGGLLRWSSPGSAAIVTHQRTAMQVLRRVPRGSTVTALWAKPEAGTVVVLRFLVVGGSCAGLRGRAGIVLVPPHARFDQPASLAAVLGTAKRWSKRALGARP